MDTAVTAAYRRPGRPTNDPARWLAESLLDRALEHALRRPALARAYVRRALARSVGYPDLGYRIRELGGLLRAW